MRLLLIVLLLLNLLALASGLGWLGTSTPRGEPERLSNQLNRDDIVLRTPAAPDEQATAPAATTAARRAGAPASLPDPVRAPQTAASAAPRSEPPAPEPARPAFAEPAPAVRPEPAAAAAAEGAGDAPAAARDVKAPDEGAPLGRPAGLPSEPRACVAFDGLTEAQADALAADAPAGVEVARSMTATPTAWWVRIPPEGGRDAAAQRVEEIRALGVTDYFIVRDTGPNQFAISLGLFKTQPKAEEHLEFLRGKGVRGAAVAPRTAATYRIEYSGPAAAVAALDAARTPARAGGTRSECTQ